MQYTWPFIVLFFWLPVAICHAETKAGAIKDAEFIIEKQKKNTVTQEQKLFFKAPMPTTKGLHKPLKTLQEATLEDILFDPAPALYFPFGLKQKGAGPSFHHYCSIGMGSLLLPYVELGLGNTPFVKGIWSTNLAFVPALWNKKAREASLALQGRYGLGSWRLQPHLNYQYAWHKYSDATAHTCKLHQGNISLWVKQASESSTQDGQVDIKITGYQDKNINEQLCRLKYKWVKQLNHWSLQLASYNDIASYTNDRNQQKRFILSATPSLCIHLSSSMLLKAGVRMAYHNDPILGTIPNFDLYPMAKIGYVMATWLSTYIGIKGMGVGGSVIPLHLHDIVAKNPFIASSWKLSHPHQYLKVYGGSKGIIAPKLAYYFHIAYRQLKNQSRIVSVTKDQIRLHYNPKDYNLLKTTGLVSYGMPDTRYRATIKGTYYQYFENSSAPIWWYHKPLYKLKPTFTYKPHSKVWLTGNLDLRGPTVVKDINGTSREIGTMINLSLGMDYFISKRLAAFVMISNLLNRSHIAYTGYPDKKINITAGLAYRW